MGHAARRVWSSMVPVAVLGTVLVLGGCSRESGDWKSAQGTDTIEAYEGFLKQHPQSEFAAQALERTKQLAEERDWQVATQADTADAYQQFLTQYPEGKWAQEARVRIENFNVMEGGAAPAAATTPPAAPTEEAAPAPTPAAPSAAAAATAKPESKPEPKAEPKPVAAPKPSAEPKAAAAPKPAPAAAPKPAAAAKPDAAPAAKPSAAGSYRVQLGAFSSEDTARAEWRRVAARFGDLKSLTPLVTAVQTGSGKLYRLQAGLASEGAARELCTRLKAGGQACIFVPPR